MYYDQYGLNSQNQNPSAQQSNQNSNTSSANSSYYYSPQTGGNGYWNGNLYSAQPPLPPKKPKKNHWLLKWIAGSAAVATFAFSFGYLGSNIANMQLRSEMSQSQSNTQSGSAPVTNTATLSDEEEATITEKVAAATANSVVEITTEGVTTDEFFRQRIQSGAGSGVIISSDGYIVTNNHVIENSNKITVTLRNGTQYTAKLVGTDKKTDIAVIKIDATGLQAAVFGDSSKLNVGEPAIVIGNPLGQLGGTVTNGIISALDREITIDGEVMTLLQTNAAISPGNSGGALFNRNGELVGIVNAKSDGSGAEGLGFAIPINTAKPVIENLIEYGYVHGRIELGMTVVDIEDSLSALIYGLDGTGVYVLDVTSGSNVDKAGIRPGDRIITVDGQQISSSSDITTIITNKQVGDKIEITISRDGRKGTATITLEENKNGSLSA